MVLNFTKRLEFITILFFGARPQLFKFFSISRALATGTTLRFAQHW